LSAARHDGVNGDRSGRLPDKKAISLAVIPVTSAQSAAAHLLDAYEATAAHEQLLAASLVIDPISGEVGSILALTSLVH
jgi:hypothetical protein